MSLDTSDRAGAPSRMHPTQAASGERAVARATPAVAFGRIFVGQLSIDGSIAAPGALPHDEALVLFFLPEARAITLRDGVRLDCRAGDLAVVPASNLAGAGGAPPLRCTALLASRRFLRAAIPERSSGLVLARSASVDAMRCHVERLYALGADAFEAVQCDRLAQSVHELLAAAAVPLIAPARRGVRREDVLLDRIIAHLDAELTTDLTVPSLCEALGCSRSALYRAAAPVGGLIELLIQRRLAAVYRALSRPGDRRSIAETARAHGFADGSQFSRRFRRAFGISAGGLRAATDAPSPGEGALLHPDTARVFTVANAPMRRSKRC